MFANSCEVFYCSEDKVPPGNGSRIPLLGMIRRSMKEIDNRTWKGCKTVDGQE